MGYSLYFKYPLNYYEIYKTLERKKAKTVTFFVDLQNIARGLYNKKTIELEISEYDEKKTLNTLPKELFDYLKNLNTRYQKFDPFFIIFFDQGYCRYHTGIRSDYKANRKIVDPDHQLLYDIFVKLKEYYFNVIYDVFNRYDNCIVIYLKNYETDFVPHYIIKQNYLDTQRSDNVNFILSSDKDILQTTAFSNTYQCVTTYKHRKYHQKIYDNYNALSFIYSGFKPGILDARYVPLVLSIAGDESDNIKGIKGYGPKKAIDFIIKHDLKPDLSDIDKVKDVIDVKKIKENYKLISFDYLIDHINQDVLKQIDVFFV